MQNTEFGTSQSQYVKDTEANSNTHIHTSNIKDAKMT